MNDIANVLDGATVSELDALIRQLQAKTGAEIAVVTVDSIQSDVSAFEYANKVAESRKPGPTQEFNGVVFVARVKEHDSVVLVSASLQRRFRNEQFRDIENRLVRPRLQRSEYTHGVRDGTEAIAAVLSEGFGGKGVDSHAFPSTDSRQKAAKKTPEGSLLATSTIITQPPGATVIIDRGTHSGSTPFSVSLKPGAHGLQISKEGYKTKLDMIRTGSVAKEYTFELEPVTVSTPVGGGSGYDPTDRCHGWKDCD